MNWYDLTQENKDFIDRYIRCSGKTREEALKEKMVQEIIYEQNNGVKERLIFI